MDPFQLLPFLQEATSIFIYWFLLRCVLSVLEPHMNGLTE